MKIPNREINIFNMSMLDVICGALGAFLIVTVVLFPSYQNKASTIVQEIGKTKDQNERLRREIEKARRAAEVTPRTRQVMQENERLEKDLAALKKTQSTKPSRSAKLNLSTGVPLLFWITWRKPKGVTRVENAEFMLYHEFQWGSGKPSKPVLYHRIGSSVTTYGARWGAATHRSNQLLRKNLAYALFAAARPGKLYVVYRLRKTSQATFEKFEPGLQRERLSEPLPVYGFAVLGNREITLPEVSFRLVTDSILVGVIHLGAGGSFRFEERMEWSSEYWAKQRKAKTPPAKDPG